MSKARSSLQRVTLGILLLLVVALTPHKSQRPGLRLCPKTPVEVAGTQSHRRTLWGGMRVGRSSEEWWRRKMVVVVVVVERVTQWSSEEPWWRRRRRAVESGAEWWGRMVVEWSREEPQWRRMVVEVEGGVECAMLVESCSVVTSAPTCITTPVTSPLSSRHHGKGNVLFFC